MTNNRVTHTGRGYTMKYKSALKGIFNCALAWVDEGISVRDLTLAEAIQSRNEQARLREPLEYAELPGIVFRPPIGQEKANQESAVLVYEAHQFARDAAA